MLTAFDLLARETESEAEPEVDNEAQWQAMLGVNEEGQGGGSEAVPEA